MFPAAVDEGTAWGLGIEAGSKNKIAQLGFGYWSIEANAFPSMLIDSDITEGKTNRAGFLAYGSKQVLRNADLKVTLYLSDELETDLPDFTESVTDAERFRIQADMIFTF